MRGRRANTQYTEMHVPVRIDDTKKTRRTRYGSSSILVRGLVTVPKMQPNVFRARLAHCNHTSWNRSLDDAKRNINSLLECDLNDEQIQKVYEKKRKLEDAIEAKTATTAKTTTTAATANTFQVPHSLSDYLQLKPAFFHASPSETQSMIDFMRTRVQSTPNPRNPSTLLRRKQCTFVLPHVQDYEFGQFNQHFRSPKDEWPELVKRAFDQVVRICDRPECFTAVHANLYEDGGVGVDPHSDKEHSMVKGLPIFSITLLEDPTEPRPFSIYTNDKTKICDVPLGHGDMLVMTAMQDDFKHGIEKHRPFKKYRPRVNFTIRAMKPSPLER